MRKPRKPANTPIISNPTSSVFHFADKTYQVTASVGQKAIELIVALLVMVMVERNSGQQGLGIYAYLAGCLYAARYMADYGVSRYVERETAVAMTASSKHRIIRRGLQANVLTGAAGAALLLASAGFDTAHTKIQESMAAYVIIAMILPLANYNQLKLSILNGLGDHGRAARLRLLRQGIILGGMLVLTGSGVPPSYLLMVYLPAEIVLIQRLHHPIKLPRILTAFSNPKKAIGTLNRGQSYLFTDNALDLMLNVDLFVLGLFVTSKDLGGYAEAAVLVRFFLIVPVALKPILRRTYVIIAARHQTERLIHLLRRYTAILFYLHAVLALIAMLHFPAVLVFFFGTDMAAAQSFQIFAIFVPGLLFYGPFCAQEPVYEALGQADALKRLTLVGVGINLFLTIYLVPAAGFLGAATATMITMVIYVCLFGRELNIEIGIDKSAFLTAGLGTYLIYMLLKWLTWGMAFTLLAGPMMLGLLFYACGVFGVREGPNFERG